MYKYELSQCNASEFDPQSIMLYPFPGELLGGKGRCLVQYKTLPPFVIR